MTMAEKILAAPRGRRRRAALRQAGRRRRACASTAATRTSSPPRRCTHFLERGVRRRTTASTNPAKFAVFEDHLIYADERAEDGAVLAPRSRPCATCSAQFQRHTGVRDFSAANGVSPGICHEVAREQIIEPGDFIQATDSHTCMGGVNGALA